MDRTATRTPAAYAMAAVAVSPDAEAVLKRVQSDGSWNPSRSDVERTLRACPPLAAALSQVCPHPSNHDLLADLCSPYWSGQADIGQAAVYWTKHASETTMHVRPVTAKSGGYAWGSLLAVHSRHEPSIAAVAEFLSNDDYRKAREMASQSSIRSYALSYIGLRAMEVMYQRDAFRTMEDEAFYILKHQSATSCIWPGDVSTALRTRALAACHGGEPLDLQRLLPQCVDTPTRDMILVMNELHDRDALRDTNPQRQALVVSGTGCWWRLA